MKNITIVIAIIAVITTITILSNKKDNQIMSIDYQLQEDINGDIHVYTN